MTSTKRLTERFSNLSMSPIMELETEYQFQRLPTDVLPLNYNLHFDPSFLNPEFTCFECIDVEVLNVTNQIIMNAAGLNILQVKYEDESGIESSEAYGPIHVLNTQAQTLKICFKKSLPKGKGKLTLGFTGIINEDWKGFYRFKDSRTKKAAEKFPYTFGTHFESCHARRAFPCWDEPRIKATFEISLVVPIPLMALSNMPKSSSESGGSPGKSIVKFSRTPPMSTYLVAFVIGEFEHLKTECTDGVMCNMYTSIGKGKNAEFAQEVASKLLPFYSDYFGHPYPLPKLDIVLLREFCSGGMENWGLVTFHESKLLTEVSVTSSRTKQMIAQTLAHELSHQWFGNLVTFDWWNDLWLKEGMALFLEYHAVNQVYPEYDSWAQFTTQTLIPALEVDGLEMSHPIAVEVNDTTEITVAFDRLSYIKGGALIRMLHNYLTDKIFRKGLSLHITRHQLKTSTADNLWSALEEVSSKPIKAMMDTWTRQKGFPLLKICFDESNETSRTFTITQEKFCGQPRFSENKIDFLAYQWVVPITFASPQKPSEPCFNLLMNGAQARLINFTIQNLRPNDWVKINSGLQGYFRVHYPADMLAEFVPPILAKTMHPLDRLGLLDDLFSMVKTGDVGTVEMLRFMRSYMKEDNFNVWCVIDNIVRTLNILLSFTDLHYKFQNYAKREIFKDIEEKIGWEKKPTEGHSDGLLRVLVLSRMVSLGSEKTIRQAKECFKNRNKTSIPPDLRSVVYRAILRSGSGSAEALESLLTIYKESNNQEEQLRILRALGSVSTPALMAKVLNFAMSDEVKPGHVLSAILGMCLSKTGIEFAWNFFKENSKIFKQRFPIGQFFIEFIKQSTLNFASGVMAQDVEQFFKENEFEGMDSTVQHITENILINEEWIIRDERHLRTFLTKV